MLVMEETYYKPEQIAQRLQVSIFTIKKLLQEGKIEGYKVGGQWRVSETAIQKYLDEKKNKK